MMIRSLLVLCFLLTACMAISDATRVNVRIPPKDFTIDATSFHLPMGSVPALTCDVNCTQAAGDLCPGGTCTGECDPGGSNLCRAHVPVTVKNDYDLSKDASEYQQFASLGIVMVTVDAVYFNIAQNSLTIDTPELSVTVGPQTINAPTDAGAELVGKIPSVAARRTGRVDVVFSSGGQATLKRFMDNFKTPFRVIVSGDVVVRGGQETPAGKLVGQVIAEGHVSL